MGNRKFLIVGLVVLVLVAVGSVAFLVFTLSQPELPPAAPAAVTPTTTPAVTTPATTTPATTDTTDTTTTADATDDDSSFVDTSGDISVGVLTNICGLVTGGDTAGIGLAEGTCGKCENLEGTNGSCQPGAGELLFVTACSEKTGIECSPTNTDGVVVAEDLSGLVFISDYMDEGCTIQLSVYGAGGSPSGTTEPLDFIVFQKDECGDVTTTSTTNTNDPGGVDTSLATCGGFCSTDADCGNSNSCSSDGVCILSSCLSDPSQCEDGDLCTYAAGSEPIDTELDGLLCGETCAIDGDCSTGLSCLDSVCVAQECVAVDEADGSCANGCYLAAQSAPTGVGGGTVQCGGVCAADGDCTLGNVCSPEGTCVATFCADGQCDNGCELPQTALISDEADRLLLGIVVLLIGLVAIRTGAHQDLFYGMGGRALTALFSESEKEKLKEETGLIRENDKRKSVANAKKSREEFENSITDNISEK